MYRQMTEWLYVNNIEWFDLSIHVYYESLCMNGMPRFPPNMKPC